MLIDDIIKKLELYKMEHGNCNLLITGKDIADYGYYEFYTDFNIVINDKGIRILTGDGSVRRERRWK